MRSARLCLAMLVLLAVPVLAQSTPACGAKASLSLKALGLEPTAQYLAPEERLFFGLAGLDPDAALEVRYFIDGKPHLAEVVDLATSRLPQTDVAGQESVSLKTALEEERMVELLALRPDLIRQLQQRAEKGASVRIEVHQAGRQVESLSLPDFKQRSADLKSRAVPLVVRSTVSGPGNRDGNTMKSVVALTYLPDCGDCTTEMPCDTECGWDPGKGGPVTCGEQGQPCGGGGCACSASGGEFWTGWYVYNAYYSSQYACFEDYYNNRHLHQQYVQQLRRDRIRQTIICPNCPSCSGCYTQDETIDYQLSNSSCWSNTYSYCSWPQPLCCSVYTCSYNSNCIWNC